MGMQVALPLAHDIAENARPKTEEFIENVMRPAVQDLIETLEKQADEMSKKVQNVSWCINRNVLVIPHRVLLSLTAASPLLWQPCSPYVKST